MILPLTAPEGEISITSILAKCPDKKRMDAMKEYSRKMTMHMTGLHKSDYVAKMDYFEDSRLLEIRKQNAPSNEDFFSKLQRPIDKVFTARGGSANYYLSETNKKKLEDIIRDIWNGYNLDKWLQTFYMPPFAFDPTGVIVMEIGDGITYPAYICTESIYYYPPTSSRYLDYLFIEDKDRTEKAKKTLGYGGEKYYRVVDDAFDYMIKWNGAQAVVIEDETYPNYYGEVRAVTVGDIYDIVKGWHISPYDNIIDLADNLFRDRSVWCVFKLHHGFPIKWQYKGVCPRCKGTGRVGGETCTACNGTGGKTKYDVAETITLPVPTDKDQPILAPNVAGYVTPPVETWQQMEVDIENYFKDAFYAIWGTQQTEDSSNETATGRFLDVQPVNDRLGKYTDTVEWMATWIIDSMGEFYFGNDYKGCDKNYGRRYLIETPDVIWDKYIKARKSGIASIGSLNNMLLQYIQSEFQSDSLEQMKQIKLMKLEPFVHMTVEQAKNNIIDPTDYAKKLYFSQFVNSLSENELLTKDIKQLDAMLSAFIVGKRIEAPPKEPALP